MLIRKGLFAVLLLAGIPIGSWAWSDSGDRFQLRVAVIENPDKPRRDVEAVIVVPKDGLIQSVSGGESPSGHAANGRQFGHRINGSLSNDGTKLALKIDFSSVVHTDDKESTVIYGQYVDLQTTVVPGIKKRLHCGGDRWCEVIVERSSPGLLNQSN